MSKEWTIIGYFVLVLDYCLKNSLVAWLSIISSRVNSISFAEILAPEDADDEVKALAKALNEL